MAVLTPGLWALAPEPASAAPGPQNRVKGSWIVVLEEGRDAEEDSEQVAKDHGGSARYVYDEVLGGFNFRGPDDRWDELRDDPRVKSVVPDLPVRKTAETLPDGIRRIDARHPNDPDAHELGFEGQGVRIAILDTGIDLDHPDLNVNASLGKACATSSKNDFDGHGTHVAGTAAAVADNGREVIGVAPKAEVVPVKVLNNSGSGSTSTITCGVNHIKGLTTDSDPNNDIHVANMSLSGSGGNGHCNNGSLRQAICEATDAGIAFAVAAGNGNRNASNDFPANYPETITVSAITDYDGEPGGNAGCKSEPSGQECDDTFWSASNHGSVVDLTADGVRVLSTQKGGGTETRLGTSMSSPHVAGVAALLEQADPSLTPDEIRDHMKSTGECPNGEVNGGGGDCSGQGTWGSNDNDGNPEPLVNAFNALQTYGGLPDVSWDSPSSADTLDGTTAIEITASDEDEPSSALDVDWRVNGGDWREATNPTIGTTHTASWNTADTADGFVDLEARATDSDGLQAFASIDVKVRNSATTQLLEDFEGTGTADFGDWTTSGLWGRVDDTGCISPGYTSATHSMYFGDESGGCDYKTGSREQGSLTSPTIGVGDTAELSFQYWREVESWNDGTFDVTTVEVTYDGGSTWQEVWTRSSKNSSDRSWTPVSRDLTPTSSQMQVRFRFDSVDEKANGHRGWFIDDVMVSSNGPPSVSWVSPTDGEQVTGTHTLQIDAEDSEDPSPTVEWRVDGGSWNTATHDSGTTYTDSWNSAAVDDGEHTLEAKATDDAGTSSTAQITVDTENTDDPPLVSWVDPADGATVRGDVPIVFDASDPEGDTISASWKFEPGGAYTSVPESSTPGRYETSWGSADVPDGSYTLYARAVANGKTTTETIEVSVLNEVLLFSDGTSDSGWSTGGLWHSSSACGSPSPGSGHPAWYYGEDGDCQYSTGSRTQGYLVSPEVGDLGDEVVLDLLSARKVESYSGGAYDRTHIEVSWDGGSSWNTIWSRDSRNSSDGSWQPLHFELTPQGPTFQVRFWFDSRDDLNNGFLGWLLDDIEAKTNKPPELSWTAPSDGAQVDGTVPLDIAADDPEDGDGTLTVEWRADDGAWQGASHDSGTSYTDSWDSATVDDGEHTLEARATDAGDLTTRASITVEVDNVDEPPQVAWVEPSDGGTVRGTDVPIAIEASDDRDTPTVEWTHDGGTTWNTATDGDSDGVYTDTWDSTSVDDGEFTFTARADDGTNPPQTTSITVFVRNDALLFSDGTSTTDWTMGGLWRQADDGCVPGGSPSGSPVFHYGQGDCDYGTGSRTTGSMTSRTITGLGESVRLEWSYWRHVESYNDGAYDRAWVEASFDDGASWETVWYKDSRDASQRTWETVTEDLTTTGGEMRVRFRFDSRDDVNNGLPGWFVDDVRVTTSGEAYTPTRFTDDFSGDVSDWGRTGLWHPASTCVSGSPGSGHPAFYYGEDADCEYSTGSRTQGALTSPAVDHVASGATLTFRYWREVESYNDGAYDKAMVEVSSDGGSSWSTVWQRDSRHTSQASWQQETVSLNASSSEILIRFRFDSRDDINNTFTGWFVDDVRVENPG